MKQALVTGGTRGIGYGITAALLDAGWSVVATGVSEAEVNDCPAADRLQVRVLDVTDQAAVDALADSLGSLAGLVNCAGIVARGREYEIDAFRHVIEVNLVGTMRMCLACRELLGAASGAIVNIASMLSFFGGPLVPAYTASKGGVAQLTKSLAAHWAVDGIRVNAVAPGWIESDLTRVIVEDPDRSDRIIARTPMGRWGRPEDIGPMVAWLLSAEAGFVTGAVMPVDGGYSAT